MLKLIKKIFNNDLANSVNAELERLRTELNDTKSKLTTEYNINNTLREINDKLKKEKVELNNEICDLQDKIKVYVNDCNTMKKFITTFNDLLTGTIKIINELPDKFESDKYENQS